MPAGSPTFSPREGAMNDIRSLKVLQLDALREVANIGGGHAATALSQLIGRTVMVSVPTVVVCRLADVPPLLPRADEPVAAVLIQMLGDLTGHALLVFPSHTASRIAELLLHRATAPDASDFDAMERSAIQEAGNILSAAYLSALSDFMGMLLLPSPPSLAVDMSAAVLTHAYRHVGSERDEVL